MKLNSFLLSMLLTVTLLLANISDVGALAADQKYENALKFITQLGITDDITFEDSTMEVNRAQYTAMVIRALNIAGADSYDGTFTDVPKSAMYSSEIYMAKFLRLVNGTSRTKFSPQEPVTYQMAMKVLVSALGYESMAIVKGGYPTGFLIVGNELNLSSGLGSVYTKNLTLRDVAILIFNGLHADLMDSKSVSGSEMDYVSVPGRNLLTQNFGLTSISGVITTAGYATINPDYSSDKKMIEIANSMFETDLDCEDLLGYRADAWYDEDDMRVIAVSLWGNSQTIVLDADDIDKYSNFKLTVSDDNGRQTTYNLMRGFSFVQNGRIIQHTDEDFLYEAGTMTLVDNDADGYYDFVLAEKVEYFVVSSVDNFTYRIYDKNLPNKEVYLKNEDEYRYSVTIYNPRNNTYSPADFYAITVGMVLELRQSGDGMISHVTAMSSSRVTGNIDEISDDYIIIDGKEYQANYYFKAVNPDLKAGFRGEFLIAPDNTLTTVNDVGTQGMAYGYMLGYQSAKNSFQKPEMKILTSSDQRMIFPLADKIKIDGTVYKNTDARIEPMFISGVVPRYQLIRYAINSEEEITSIDTASPAPSDGSIRKGEPDDSLTLYLDKKVIHYKSSGTQASPFFVFGNTTVFEVPRGLITASDVVYDDEMFFASSNTALSNDERPTADAFDYTELYTAGAAVLYRVEGGAAGSARVITPLVSAQSYMVEKVTTALNSEDDVTSKITVYGGGQYRDFVIASAQYPLLVSSGKIPSPGDVIRVSTDRNGEINGIALDVDYDEENHTLKVNYGMDGLNANSMQLLTYATGRVWAHGSGIITLRSISYPTSGTAPLNGIVPFPKSSACRFVLFDASTGIVRAAREGDVKTIVDNGEYDASLVSVEMNYHLVPTVFIYLGK